MISVVVDNWNNAPFLREAIASAVAQAPDVIVVDDGSSDGSRDVIHEFGDEIVAVFQDNRGQMAACAAGFERARGDSVLFLDGDDALERHALERAGERATKETAQVRWPVWAVDEQGRRAGRVPVEPLPEGDLRDAIVREGPLCLPSPPTSANVWSRTFLERAVPTLDLDERRGVDAYLSALAPICGLVATIPEPLTRWRLHSGSNSLKPLNLKSAEHLARWERSAEVVSGELAREGVVIDVEDWRARNPFVHTTERLRHATERIAQLTQPGERYVLVDGGAWALHEPAAGRRAVRFLERGGRYWLPPPNNEVAIRELERRRAEGVRLVVVTWHAFAWLEQLALSEYFGRFERAAADRDLLVVDVRQPTRALTR